MADLSQEVLIKVANFVDPQFVDANGVGGLNAAFGTVSGSVSSLGMGVWAQTGLVSPESMTLSFSGMTAAAGLPSPWAILTSGGVIVHAHGTQTGADTTNYSVNFTSLVPGSGSVTAYLAAAVTQIQQNPFPLTGPPQGHPSFNPNFVPSTAYATLAYSVSLTAATGVPDNLNTFELARTTLTAGQVAVSGFSTAGWQRATPFNPRAAATIASGGALTLSQSALTVLPTASGLTSTLPLVVSGGGLKYQLVNPSSSTAWTIAAPTGNTIGGSAGTPVTSMGIPPYGAVQLWGNAVSGVWEVLGVNPLMMASLPNIFTAPQTIATASPALTLSGSGAGGAGLLLTGNGATTPSKRISVSNNGVLSINNNANNASVMTVDDTGNLVAANQIIAASMAITGSGSIGSGLTVTSGGVRSVGFDAGGMQIRTALSTGPAAGFRNDGTNFYLLLSTTPTGSFTAARPFTVALATNRLTLDSTGAGVVFGGGATIPSLVATAATVGAVSFPGGGSIIAPGTANIAGQLVAGAVSTIAGDITAGARLRAAFGAYLSGDPNAGVILNDFTASNVANGFLRFPTGDIIQWGGINVPISNTANLFTLNLAFPNNFFVVHVVCGAFSPLAGAMMGGQPASLTQFWVTVSSATSVGQSLGSWWIAIGN